jgi:hypothetical protein
MLARCPSVGQLDYAKPWLDRLKGAAADQTGLLTADLQTFDHVLLAAELARWIDVDFHPAASPLGDVTREAGGRDVPTVAFP